MLLQLHYYFLLSFSLVQISHQDPTARDWDTLNSTVNGHLIHPLPLAHPCFQLTDERSGSFNLHECSLIAQDYLNDKLRTANVGSYINTQWETCQSNLDQCLLDSNSPSNPAAFLPPRVCRQGSIPSFAIEVHTAADIVAGFKFSDKHQVPIVIKSTGHDYKGHSSAPESLALWMHKLQSISFNHSFIPSGCPSNSSGIPGITFGAGVSFLSLMDFAESNNITIPTAGDGTVAGGGGYLQGGGHSVLSNAFGLAVDHALEFEVVTPSGQHIFANKCQFQDLFFALRGGGGGTFGVVLGVTSLALPQLTMNIVKVNIDPIIQKQKRLVEFMAAHALNFAKAGWGGFTLPLTGGVFVNAILDPGEAQTTIEPLVQFITQELEGNATFQTESSYKAYYEKFTVNVATGTPLAASSRLIPVDNFNSISKQQELSLAINAAIARDQNLLPILFASPPFLYGDKGGTSVTPIWRTSLWHVVYTKGWNFNSSKSDIIKVYKSLSAAIEPLRQITPGAGAYQNEADVYEPNFQESFWGINYNKLLDIKRK